MNRQRKYRDAALAYKSAVLLDPNLKLAKSNTVNNFNVLRDTTVRVYRVETGILAECENGLCCGDGNGISTA